MPKPEPEVKPVHETTPKLSLSRSSSIALLEDLLEQTEVVSSNEIPRTQSNLLNLQEEFPLKSGGNAWDVDIGSGNTCAGS